MRHDQVKFCPCCGTPVQLEFQFGQERPVCPACGWLHFADPKVAAAVLVEQAGQVLLVQRANDPFKGLWTLPVGFVDAGEDPAAAAARECLEEAGLAVKITGIIDIRFGREHPRGSDFVIFYRGEALGNEIHAGDDASAAGWFERGKLPRLAFQSTVDLLSSY
jgi:ADP-ribose pyrophosphatase YjhB (NUDIX family)